MGLTAKQRLEREGKLTASAVACLMTGDKERIYDLWLELTGDPTFVPPDFSDHWPVQLGVATEELNLAWFEKKHGKLSLKGKVMVHPEFNWAACTLDGWHEDRACPVECKHSNGFTKTDELLVRYMPQMQWQMFVTDAEECAFSVIQGAREPEVVFVQRDKEYIAELFKRGETFMAHVRNMTPPVVPPSMEAKPKVEAVKEYNFETEMDDTKRVIFQETATIWAVNKARAKLFDDSAKVLKKIVPDDAARAYGFGIEITRNKAGSLTIKEV